MIYYLVAIAFIGPLLFFYREGFQIPFQSRAAVLNLSDVQGVELDKYSFFVWVGFFGAIALVIKALLFDQINVPSESMLPTVTVGSKYVVNKTSFGLRSPLTYEIIVEGDKPELGQVVVARFPLNPDVLYIKRVLGRPGDILSLNSAGFNINGILYPIAKVEGRDELINKSTDLSVYDIYDVKLDKYHWQFMVDKTKEFPTIEQIEIPANTFYVLGDNITNSSDSRVYGPIPFKYFVGKPINL